MLDIFVAGNSTLAIEVMDYSSCNLISWKIRIAMGLLCMSTGIWAISSGIVHRCPRKLAGQDHFYRPTENELILKGGIQVCVASNLLFWNVD